MTHMILIAIGTDRPGLVDEISQFIFDRGGNIEDSRMVNLRGQFAVLILIGGGKTAMERITSDLETFAHHINLQVELRPADQAPAPAAHGIPYRLTATAMDQAGLVHRIAHLLHSLHVNIESLESHLASAPYTGAPIFEMEVILSIPQKTSIHQLRNRLDRLCGELNIDWTLEPV